MEMASCSKPPMKQAFLKNNSLSESFLSPHKVSSLSQCHCGGAQQFISLKHFSQTSRKSLCAKTHSTLRDNTPQRQIAVLLEVEGVLVDVYRAGNRHAFNIGWPTSLPTNEKEQFLKSVLQEKRKALDEYVMTRSIPLRPGAENFIDDALKEDIPVVILTAYSKNGDKMARSVIDKLGLERLSKIKIVGNEGVEKSFYGQFVFGKGVSASLDEQLAKEARKAASAEKQRIAEEVSSKLKLSVEIDTTSSEILEKVVATLRAGAEYAGLPVPNCILIAGSQSGALAAERIGMPCLVLRSSFTARAEFRSARAVMEGFGAGDLTISKLLNRRWD